MIRKLSSYTSRCSLKRYPYFHLNNLFKLSENYITDRAKFMYHYKLMNNDKEFINEIKNMMKDVGLFNSDRPLYEIVICGTMMIDYDKSSNTFKLIIV